MRSGAQSRPGGHSRNVGGIGAAIGDHSIGSAGDQRSGGDGRVEFGASAVQSAAQQAAAGPALHHLRHSDDSFNVGGQFTSIISFSFRLLDVSFYLIHVFKTNKKK